MDTEQQLLQITQAKLFAFVRTIIGGGRGREDDEHPLPPGPWDPVIRVALERTSVFGPSPEPWRRFLGNPVPWRSSELVFGPQPEPWQVVFASILARYPEIWDGIGGGHSFGGEVALNPQPLPPRFTFLVSLAQTVISRAELLQDVADATVREGEQQGLIPKWPFPGPPPPWWANELDGIDLVVLATQFDKAAKETFSQDLRQNLADASAKLAEVGISKMQ